LAIGEVVYEIVDEQARNDIATTHRDISTKIQNTTLAATVKSYFEQGVKTLSFGATDCADLPNHTTGWDWDIFCIFGSVSTVIAHRVQGEGVSETYLRSLNPNTGGWIDAEWSAFADGSKCLPLTGGTLTGATLGLNNGNGNITADSSQTKIETKVDSNNYRVFGIVNNSAASNVKDAVQLIDRTNGIEKGYSIFGDHNKPSGSYTGNGSAASRTIDIGSTVNAVLLFNNSGSSSGIITAVGGIFWNGTTVVSSANIKVAGSSLVITGVDDYFNANGVTYSFQSL
jgi:hypothetical protein